MANSTAGSAPSPAELAAQYGLSVAGARPSLAAYARQLFTFRHFIATFANARLVVSYNTSRLGRFWQVLTPLTNAAVYFLIFGVILQTGRGVPNFIGYLCIGIFVFSYTQLVVSAGASAISSNLGLIRALHFPRACLPLGLTVMQSNNVLVSYLVLVVIVIGTGERPGLDWLLLVPAVVLHSLFNAGLGMALARIGAKLPDVRQVLPFIMRTWMYASGVLYSATLFAEHLPDWAAAIAKINPLLVYIELARNALLESPDLSSPPSRLWPLAVIWAVVMAVAGFIYFWRGEEEYGRG